MTHSSRHHMLFTDRNCGGQKNRSERKNTETAIEFEKVGTDSRNTILNGCRKKKKNCPEISNAKKVFKWVTPVSKLQTKKFVARYMRNSYGEKKGDKVREVKVGERVRVVMRLWLGR